VRIAVTHNTVYHYSAAIFPEPHIIRLCPRQDGAQRLLQYALEIEPVPAGRTECLDQDGNLVVEAWFDQPVETLSLKSAFRVETLRVNPFDFLLHAGTGRLPLGYLEPLGAALEPYRRQPAGAAREFAAEVAAAAPGALEFLLTLTRRLAQEFRYVERDTGAPHPAEITLGTREGSCRDLAVLFCEAARAMGIAARFVSGYQCGAGLQGKIHMHAWAEVYLEGGGWRGYDPSAGLAVAGSHVAVAAAADPRLAAPVTGAYRGVAEAVMEFAIAMQSSG
jgi:transglutaminase-like putative cysteine protease